MQDVEVEVFRADTRASKGLTAAHIAKAATLYDADKAPAPLVFGHPKNDSPALGHISKLRAEGSKLFATLRNVKDDVVAKVRNREILGRSIAFWDPRHPSNPTPGEYTVRHLGLLAGQAPAIPGMPALKFSAEEDALEDGEIADALVYSVEDPTPVQTIIDEEPPAPAPKETTVEITQAQLDSEKQAREAAEARVAELEKAEETRAAEFAASEKARRDGEDKAVLDKAVADGRILPAERADFDALFSALPTTALTFSAGEREPRQFLASFLETLTKRAPVGDNDAVPRSPTEFSVETTKAAQKEAEDARAAQLARMRDAHKPAA